MNEKGVVLVTVMIVILLLSLIALGANSNITTDTTIVSNYSNGTKALYIAEAGLQRAKNECIRQYMTNGWSDFDTILSNGLRDANDNAMTGSEISFHDGTFRLWVSNDGDSGNSTNDVNRTIVIKSRGTVGSSTVTVEAHLRMNVLPIIPGAVTVVGEADTNNSFNGTSFRIDGRDWRIADTEETGPTGTDTNKYGIAVGDIASYSAQGTTDNAVTSVIGDLGSSQRPLVTGSGTASATPSVGAETTVTKENLRALADAMRLIADNSLYFPGNCTGNTALTTMPGTDYQDNCVSNWPSGKTTCFGTQDHPKITYIDAIDNSIDNTGVTFSGNITGYGVLVLDGNDLKITGTIDWTGLIIQVGDFGSISFGSSSGSGTRIVKGAVICSEYLTDPTTYREFVIYGATKLRYSKEALDMVKNYMNSKGVASLVGWHRVYY